MDCKICLFVETCSKRDTEKYIYIQLKYEILQKITPNLNPKVVLIFELWDCKKESIYIYFFMFQK